MSLQDVVEILICQPCNNWLVPLFPDFSCVSCCFFGVCISARVSCVWSLTTRISPSGSGWPCECLQGLPVPGAWQGGEPPSMCGEQVCRIGRNRRQGWMPLDAQLCWSALSTFIFYIYTILHLHMLFVYCTCHHVHPWGTQIMVKQLVRSARYRWRLLLSFALPSPFLQNATLSTSLTTIEHDEYLIIFEYLNYDESGIDWFIHCLIMMASKFLGSVIGF